MKQFVSFLTGLFEQPLLENVKPDLVLSEHLTDIFKLVEKVKHTNPDIIVGIEDEKEGLIRSENGYAP
ncbi:hypothetical protein ACIQZI_06040 [Peribacillus sp. NPDC096379]|uniref:hypothetical protein n=1 Tax=Peribacillus sp. NPDC096379 TaxID=3364393 RepID=UPI0037F584E8